MTTVAERVERGFERERVAKRAGTALPPEPAGGMTVHFLRWLLRPVELMDECQRRFGDRFTVRMPYQGPVVFFSSPQAIKDIFTGSPDDLYAGEANAVLEPIVGPHSLLLLDGPRHVRERRLLLPPFHGERMLAYGRTMEAITRRAMETVPIGERFEVHPLAQRITLDVILETVMGVDDPAERRVLGDALTELGTKATSPLLLIPFFQIDWGPRSTFRRVAILMREVDRLLHERILRRRALGRQDREDVLSMLVEARDEDGRPMSTLELRDEMMTLLLAGHETTATTLAWALSHLVTHPDVLARAHEEIDRVCAGGPLDPSRVGELVYVDAIVKETLRLRPVIPIVGRAIKKPTEIDGTLLPVGAMAAPCIYLAHRHPAAWPDPERFDPRRFLDRKPTPYEFLPFGGGVRRCIGMAFALYETRVVLATMLRGLTPRAVPGHRTKLVRRSITFSPSDGMPVIFERR